MVSFHAADSYSILGVVLGVAFAPLAILSLLFLVAHVLSGM